MAKKSFPCHICGKILTRSFILKNHLKSHTDERQFQCSVCNKAFVRAYDCKQHEAIHNEEPKYVCEWLDDNGNSRGCGRRFRRKSDLERHRGREGAASCWEDSTTVPQGQDIVTSTLPSGLYNTTQCNSWQQPSQPVTVRSALGGKQSKSLWDCRCHIDYTNSQRAISIPGLPLPSRAKNAQVTYSPQRALGSSPLDVLQEACTRLMVQKTTNRVSNGALRSAVLVPAPILRLTCPTSLPAPTNEVHQTDMLWRVSLVAGFSFYNFLVPLAFCGASDINRWLEVVNDFYSRLLRSTQHAIASIMKSSTWSDSTAQPNLLYALQYAASVMRDMAPVIGDKTGAATHDRFESRLSIHLGRGNRVTTEVSRPVARGESRVLRLAAHRWEAAYRYKIRIENCLDTRTLGLVEGAQQFLVSQRHPDFSPVYVRVAMKLNPAQVAMLCMLLQCYDFARSRSAWMTGPMPDLLYDYMLL